MNDRKKKPLRNKFSDYSDFEFLGSVYFHLTKKKKKKKTNQLYSFQLFQEPASSNPPKLTSTFSSHTNFCPIAGGIRPFS
jgi:hypothetical protein